MARRSGAEGLARPRGAACVERGGARSGSLACAADPASARRGSARRLGQAGFTAVELVLTTALLTTVTMVSLGSLLTMGRASNRGVSEQEVVRVAGELLERIARELRYADAASILFSPLTPDRITFQEVLAYEADPLTAGAVVRSRPVTLRRVLVDAASRRFGLERSEGPTLLGDELVSICSTDGAGNPATMTVRVRDLEPYLRVGATLGPCGTEPIPLALGPFDRPPVVVGGNLAEQDLDDPSLPGLHFAVRQVGGRTFVDIAVTVRARAGGEVVTRRFATTVGLVNR